MPNRSDIPETGRQQSIPAGANPKRDDQLSQSYDAKIPAHDENSDRAGEGRSHGHERLNSAPSNSEPPAGIDTDSMKPGQGRS